MKVKSYAAQNSKSPLAPWTFDSREVGPKDVLIEIAFSGICHSDIHQARDEWGGSIFPMVPGHEIVGHVKQVGAQVKNFKVGDVAGVGCMVDSCRICASCKDHLEQYCEVGFVGTYNALERDKKTPTYGGYASHIITNEDFVLHIPKNLDLAAAAPLLCAGITTYSPLKKVGVTKGHRVGVLGLGGLGHMAVKLAASFGAEVTVLSGSKAKEADAKKLGATHFALTSDEATVAKLQNHFDFILDTVAAKHDLNQALQMLKREGTLIMVGAADKPLDLSVFSLIMKRRKIMGSLIGGIKETQEMLDYCGKHNITCDIEMIKAPEINDAYERMISGKVRYRFVIDAKTF
ncbi:MAG: NAD(P)-dependent alcohol dehydrogenase [Deltaproteobacteria bacterium]|nr:NAD(P)-dependent alcohol dehydrogenase [Deltaproteobacteria bacterium]